MIEKIQNAMKGPRGAPLRREGRPAGGRGFEAGKGS
jgi:hypothetical protein